MCNLFTEYPAFQDLLLVDQFPKVTLEIAKMDGESYVRSSALTFIATIVRINKIWEQQLSQMDLTVCVLILHFAFLRYR